jgi:hypothetical protein
LTPVPDIEKQWSREVLSRATNMLIFSPVVYFLSYGSLRQAITTLHEMTSTSYYERICIINVDSAVDNCTLLQQIHLVKHLTNDMLRRYQTAPSFRARLLSSLTELEFTSATLNRVFQDPYLAQHILEFAYVVPKPNQWLNEPYVFNAICNIYDSFHLHLESTFLPHLINFYDGVKRTILENHPKQAQIERNIRDKAVKTAFTVRTLERQSIVKRGDSLSRQQFKLSKRNHDDCRAMRTKKNSKIFSKQPLARRGNKG